MKAHPTAIIHPQARVACSVVIGPYAVIEENVELGEECHVMAHAVIGGPATMGPRNRVFPFASLGLDPQDTKYRGEPTRLEIGEGNVFREFVTVHRGTAEGGAVTKIGNHNLLMAYVHIAHDCRLEDHVIMANGASLAGHVEIGSRAIVGAFCGIHQFCRIGTHSFLGAYSVINRDVLPYFKTSAERPIGVYGANRTGLERLGFSPEDIEDLETSFRLLCRSKLNTAQALEAIEAKSLKSPHVKALVDFIRSSERGVVK